MYYENIFFNALILSRDIPNKLFLYSGQKDLRSESLDAKNVSLDRRGMSLDPRSEKVFVTLFHQNSLPMYPITYFELGNIIIVCNLQNNISP